MADPTPNSLSDRLSGSTLGLGTAALGRPAYITTSHGADLVGRSSREAMEQNAHEMFDLAYANGIRYFDAARSYGLAEKFIATWIEKSKPMDITVGSKWGQEYVANWDVDAPVHEIKDHSVEAFRRQVAETRELLGDNLALYQIHSVTPELPTLHDDDVLAELGALRDEGVAIGLSTTGPNQARVLDTVTDINIDGRPLFSAVQTTWNLLETSTSDAIARLAENGVAIIVKEALANGRLSSSGDVPATAPGVEASPDAIAIAAARQFTPADIVLSGALTADHLRSNLASLDLELPDHPAVSPTAMDPSEFWSQRSELAWT